MALENGNEGRRRPAEAAAEGDGGEGAAAARERCPRCESRDTKFCYYNNYNTSQPRHFCKSCRRYWTLGGSLRNVPIGGSSRKRLRPSPSTAASVLLRPSVRGAIPCFDSSSAPASLEIVGSGAPPLPGGHGPLFQAGLFGADSVIGAQVGFGLGLGLGLGLGSGAEPCGPPIDELGFGLGPAGLLWRHTLLDEDEVVAAAAGDTWRMVSGGGDCFGVSSASSSVWPELAMASPATAAESGGATASELR